MYRFVTLLLLSLALGCSSKTPVSDDTKTEEVVEKEPVFEHPDPGPMLERVPLEFDIQQLEPRTVQAGSAVRSGDHLFITVPFDGDVDTVQARVGGDRYGWAVPDIGPTRLFVRLSGTSMPETLEIEWQGMRRIQNSVMVRRQKLTVTEFDDAATESDLPSRFRAAAAETMRRVPRQGFYRFAESRLGLMARPGDPQRGSGRTEIGSLMDLYTGMTSVKEALQYDRGLLLRGKRVRPTIPIDEIEGVGLPSHPWPKMISELATNPDVEPLAARIPHDMAYLHARDLRALIQMMEDVDRWMTPLSQAGEVNPGPAHFTQRYKDQLVVESTGLAETFGPMIAAEVALVASDPYFREGTDVSLLFKLKNKSMLTNALKAFETRARARRSDISESSYTVEGVKVQVLSTPDRAVSQHRFEIDDVLVLSSARGAVEKLLAVHADKSQPISESGEYKYFRALYPASDESEDAFLFLSDAFVQHVTSPRVKILEARRLRAQADLRAVNYAALLFGWLEGRQPKNVDELTASGVLFEDELKHSLSGSPITFETSTGATSRWGSVANLVPIIDLDIDKVDESEKAAYENFRRTYQSYWRAEIDPVGVRFSRADNGELTVDARILPLIESTEYDDLVRQAGRNSFAPTQVPDQLRLTVAVGEEAEMRRVADSMLKSYGGGREGFGIGWLGDWVAVGVADRSGVWDAAIASGEVMSYGDRTSIEQVLFSGRVPLYMMAQIRNKIAFAALVSGVRKWMQDTAPGMVKWTASQPYRETPITVISADELGGSDFGIYYTVVDDVLIVSIERATIEILIDEALAGRITKAAEPVETMIPVAHKMDTQAAIQVDFAGSSWLAKTFAALIEGQMLKAAGAASHSYVALHRGLGGVLDQNDVRSLGLTYLGFEPRHPHGGQFSIVDGFVVDPVYGSAMKPNQPELPVANSPISEFLANLQAADFKVGFAGHGMHRGLHVQFSLR